MFEALVHIPTWPLINLAALCIYILIVKRLTVFSFVFVGTLILDALHLGAEYYFISLNVLHQFDTVLFVSWYVFFGLTDLLFVALIVWWSSNLKMALDWSSKGVISLYLFMGLLQLVTLFARLYFYWESFDTVHNLLIVISNYTVSVLLLGHVALVAGLKMFSNNYRNYS